ncbi:MAG TPA: nicotinate-nucleotide--dimethylbenzimidazole phosphoribosyltransferase [Eubacteriaceae bacterium]|nr:nicotinate-nucleotide--dimethylbenzimidazole phosphoribosyltransferase [Eubacteriaceae bacterium]
MSVLKETVAKIERSDQEAKERAQKKVDGLLKPVGSLGVLERLAVQLAGMDEALLKRDLKKSVLVFAGDHGIFEEGITSAPQEVTALMTQFIANQKSGVGVIAQTFGADVFVYDVGVKNEINNEQLIPRKIRKGTNNFLKEHAMTREEAIQSIEIGIKEANHAIDKGYEVLATGEMGIGNTTPSSAIFCALGGFEAEEMTGIGANLSDEKMQHKRDVIDEAIKKWNPDRKDGIDVLAKVGGFEIGAMAGVMLAGAANKKPVLVDGFISSAAAAIAKTIEPKVGDYLICSHLSAEKGARKALEFLGFEPYFKMDMRLGEGSGAALAFPIVDAAVNMYLNMGSYADAGISVV